MQKPINISWIEKDLIRAASFDYAGRTVTFDVNPEKTMGYVSVRTYVPSGGSVVSTPFVHLDRAKNMFEQTVRAIISETTLTQIYEYLLKQG